MERTIRAFIAIEPDDALRQGLRRIQQQLKDEPAARFVRWVAPENIHLTLKFLGNLELNRVPAVKVALKEAARNIPPFSLLALGLGCFPNARRPNNIWVGLQGELELARQLTRQIEDSCAALGLARDDRGFTPHLTLGRVRRQVSNRERTAVGELVNRFPKNKVGEIHAKAFHLIQSDLYPGGPTYTMLAAIALVSPATS